MPELGNDMSQASFGVEDLALPIAFADDSVFVGLTRFAFSDADGLGLPIAFADDFVFVGLTRFAFSDADNNIGSDLPLALSLLTAGDG